MLDLEKAKREYQDKVDADTLALFDAILTSKPLYRPPYFLVEFPDPTYILDLDKLNDMLRPYDLEYIPSTTANNYIVLRELSSFKKKLQSLIPKKK